MDLCEGPRSGVLALNTVVPASLGDRRLRAAAALHTQGRARLGQTHSWLPGKGGPPADPGPRPDRRSAREQRESGSVMSLLCGRSRGELLSPSRRVPPSSSSLVFLPVCFLSQKGCPSGGSQVRRWLLTVAGPDFN